MRRRTFLLALSLAPFCAVSGQEAITGAIPHDVISEVVALYNAPATKKVSGPYTVDSASEVSSDLAVVGGVLRIASGGHVAGRILAIDADVHLESGARVDGDVLVVGGRVEGSQIATLQGSIRAYRERMSWARVGDHLVSREGDEKEKGGPHWWQRRERWRSRGWSDLRLISARTYNRVEGLPVYIGPSIGRDVGWGHIALDALGVFRSADSFEWKSENIGHSLRTEARFRRSGGVRVGARLFDLVEPVEPWHLSDPEVGLASFFLHRDFRDYYDQHGGTLYASLYRGSGADVTLSYSDQRWATRLTRDPWTLFRDTETWRPNPAMDEGNFHLFNATLHYDTRNDDRNPWSGWYLMADYEYGTGLISRYGSTSPGVRDQSPSGVTTYDRLFVDLRRYNRITPDQQLNLRLVTGGWLSGDELPLERRFSVGGPGTLAGFGFRRVVGGTDYWQCSTPSQFDVPGPAGNPAQCERFVLAQAEFRGDMHLDPFGVLDDERDWRRRGWGRGTQWVAFADAGRGWLVGRDGGELTLRAHQLPRLSTFRADVGLGLVLDDVGIYVAKGLSAGSPPINIFVRLTPRF